MHQVEQEIQARKTSDLAAFRCVSMHLERFRLLWLSSHEPLGGLQGLLACMGAEISRFRTRKGPRSRQNGLNTSIFGPTAAMLAALPGVLLLLIATNVAQNGSGQHPAPRVASLEEALSLRSKADFVAAWRAGRPPHCQGRYAGYLLPLGVLAPMSAFITNVLFGPFGRWRGKVFLQDRGRNRFEHFEARGFGAHVAPSRLDGKEALVLDYADARRGRLVARCWSPQAWRSAVGSAPLHAGRGEGGGARRAAGPGRDGRDRWHVELCALRAGPRQRRSSG